MEHSQCQSEYLRRVHAVQDYIETHPEDIPDLDTLARLAGFSKFHFHRIFKAITGETLLSYIHRIKLVRAAAYLRHAPHVPVTDIALHYGFADSSVFSRVFKAHFGQSPSAFRRNNRKICKDNALSPAYTQDIQNLETGRDTMYMEATSVEQKHLDLRVIYIRYTGSYQGLAAAIPPALQKLYGFAMQAQLLDPQQTLILSAYHDNPDMTGEAKLRTSICLSIRPDAKVDASGDIGDMRLQGDYAVGHFELPMHAYDLAWEYMYSRWLPASGMQPRDTFPFEVYVSDPSQNPGGKQLLDICIPIEPLGQI